MNSNSFYINVRIKFNKTLLFVHRTPIIVSFHEEQIIPLRGYLYLTFKGCDKLVNIGKLNLVAKQQNQFTA